MLGARHADERAAPKVLRRRRLASATRRVAIVDGQVGRERVQRFQLRQRARVIERKPPARAQFVRIASVDERVLLTRFFDHVRRLDALIDFHRKVNAELEISQSSPDAGDRKLLGDLEQRLLDVANEVRIDGLIIVTDHGDDMHRRLLGIKTTAEKAPDS